MHGNIISVSVIEARTERVTESGCWLWTHGLFQSGYGQISIYGKRMKAHVVSWMAFRGNPGALRVLHRCDVRCCVNPDHLFLGTHADNMADMSAKGRRSGEKNPQSKLTDAEVRAIYSDPRQHREIGAAYGVTHTLVGYIKRKKSWTHLWR